MIAALVSAVLQGVADVLPIIWDIGSSPTVGVGTYRQIIIPWPRILRAYDTMAAVDTVVADKGANHGKE